MQHRIFCIMGKSGTGKDTLYRELLNDGALPFERLVPCTTRPIRAGEQDGREYHFYTVDELRGYFGADKVVPIYIEVEDGERLQRALDRERAEEQPKYRELCRRFLADCEDFSDEKIAEAGITRRFENDSLERCKKEIRQYLIEMM